MSNKHSLWNRPWYALIFCFLAICIIVIISLQIALGIKYVSKQRHVRQAVDS